MLERFRLWYEMSDGYYPEHFQKKCYIRFD